MTKEALGIGGMAGTTKLCAAAHPVVAHALQGCCFLGRGADRHGLQDRSRRVCGRWLCHRQWRAAQQLRHHEGGDQETPQPVEVSDEGEPGDSDSDEPVTKKQRLDTPNENQLQNLKRRVWDEIVCGSGEAAVEELLVGTDRLQLAEALEALEEEGRIMSQDGMVYATD